MTTQQQVPAQMKAWQYESHGPPAEVLKLEYVSLPVPQASEVLVQVRAASLNPIGYKSITSFPSIMVKKPATAEFDVSGVVVGLSVDGNHSLKVGDEVYGIIPADAAFKTGRGALAQYAAVTESLLVRKDSNLGWNEAAAIPLAGMTAYQALVTEGGLVAGSRVLINGASGGVGSYAVQISKALGAHVVSTCSDRSIEFVKKLGSDEIIDYKAVGDLPAHIASKYSSNQFDIIFDTVNTPALFTQSEVYLKPDGHYVTIGADASGIADAVKFAADVAKNTYLPVALGGTNRKYKWMLLDPTQDKLAALNDLVNSGKVKSYIYSTHTFQNVIPAYESIMSHRAQGKVVVEVV